MYSAVLMLALTAGSETADFGRNRCAGSGSYACSGFVGAGGCSGSYGGGYGCSSSQRGGLFHRSSGCSGNSGGLFHRSSGCSGYAGGYGCSSNYACGGRTGMFSGGLFGGHHNRCSSGSGYGCSGYACSGSVGYGCSGGYAAPVCSGGVITGAGCTSGAPVAPPAKAMPKPSEPIPQPKKTTQSTAPATIIVNLPADARLFIDGNATVSTTARRTLVTPELAVGSTYVYTMRAEVVRDGQVQSQTQQVNVIGGQTATVQFSLSSQGVASR